MLPNFDWQRPDLAIIRTAIYEATGFRLDQPCHYATGDCPHIIANRMARTVRGHVNRPNQATGRNQGPYEYDVPRTRFCAVSG